MITMICWSLSQLSWGERQGYTLGQVRQSITGPQSNSSPLLILQVDTTRLRYIRRIDIWSMNTWTCLLDCTMHLQPFSAWCRPQWVILTIAYVIAYASRRLRGAEKNDHSYSIMKLELLALKWSVTDMFRSYFLGLKFTVIADNNPLCDLSTSNLMAIQQWVPVSSQML